MHESGIPKIVQLYRTMTLHFAVLLETVHSTNCTNLKLREQLQNFAFDPVEVQGFLKLFEVYFIRLHSHRRQKASN